MKRFLPSILELLDAYETSPQQDPAGETAVPQQEPARGGSQSRVFSADEFDSFRQSVNERLDGLGQQITEGFGWARENLAQPIVHVGDAVPDSPSENPPETIIEVQDRQPNPNRKPRARLNLGNLFR